VTCGVGVGVGVGIGMTEPTWLNGVLAKGMPVLDVKCGESSDGAVTMLPVFEFCTFNESAI
jgi:hypothetical protein